MRKREENTTTLLEYIHPNCLCFNDDGRLFVGDSVGAINIWDISVRYGKIYAENHFVIKHSALEGDPINVIIAHPTEERRIMVQSRDNCIRLIEYETSRGPKVRKRFFGAKCRDQMVKSTISPDGNWIVSGSEDGMPHIWEVDNEESYNTSVYECKFLNVSDIDWNIRYNMMAVSGFGHQYPILVYVNEKKEDYINLLQADLKEQRKPKQTLKTELADEAEDDSAIDMNKENNGRRFSQQSVPFNNRR